MSLRFVPLFLLILLTFSSSSFGISKDEYLEKLSSVLETLSGQDQSGAKIQSARVKLGSLLQSDYVEDNQLKNASLQLFAQLHLDVWIDHFNTVSIAKFYHGHMAYLLYIRGDLEDASYFSRFLKTDDLSLFQEPYLSTLRSVLNHEINENPTFLDHVLSVKRSEEYEIFGRFRSLTNIDFLTIERKISENIVFTYIKFNDKEFVSSDQDIKFITVCNDLLDSLIFKTSILGVKKYIKYSFTDKGLRENDFDNTYLFSKTECLVDEKNLFYLPPCHCKLKGEDGSQ